jgi:hypothetical protein
MMIRLLILTFTPIVFVSSTDFNTRGKETIGSDLADYA